MDSMKTILLSTVVLLITSCSTEFTKPVDQLTIERQTLIKHCLTCHSTVEMQRGPLLQGLEGWYLEEQLEAFKEGSRGGDIKDKNGQLMHSAVKAFSDEHLEFAAEWFANQPRPEIKAVVKGDITEGKELYQEACYKCHDHPMGKFFSRSPDLYKMEDWYLMSQLRAYKAGWRGVAPRDTHGIKMRAALQPYSMKQLQNIVAYLAQFKEKPEE